MESKQEKSLNGRTSISKKLSEKTTSISSTQRTFLLYMSKPVLPNKNKKGSKKKKTIRDTAMRRARKQKIKELEEEHERIFGTKIWKEIRGTEAEKELLREDFAKEAQKDYGKFVNELIFIRDLKEAQQEFNNDDTTPSKQKTYGPKKY